MIEWDWSWSRQTRGKDELDSHRALTFLQQLSLSFVFSFLTLSRLMQLTSSSLTHFTGSLSLSLIFQLYNRFVHQKEECFLKSFIQIHPPSIYPTRAAR